MTRQERYPETETFHYYNANPKNRITSDCTFRAIAAATEIPYNEVVIKLAELHCKTGYECTDKRTIDAFLKAHGWTMHKQPKKVDGTKYTGAEFCKLLSRDITMINKSVIANIGGHHIVCIKPVNDPVWSVHKVHDIWDSTDGCIGNYWTKE